METKRVAFTLPKPVLADLGYVSLRLGQNKSVLLASLLGEPLAHLRSVLFSVPGRLDQLSPEESAHLMASLSGSLDAAVSQASDLRDHLAGGTHHCI